VGLEVVLEQMKIKLGFGTININQLTIPAVARFDRKNFLPKEEVFSLPSAAGKVFIFTSF